MAALQPPDISAALATAALAYIFSRRAAPSPGAPIISELHRKGIPYKDCRKMVKGPRSNIPKGKKIIIDEFMWNPFFFKSSKINFHAAVSSSALSTILYNKKGRRLVLEKEDILEK